MTGEPVIMHVDMDAFYVSVELRRRPELVGLPVIVGGISRGVVLSASYEARAYGVRGGMPSTTARRMCPQAVVLAPDFDAYSEASKGVFAIFHGVSSLVEAASIDEAFLDVTGAIRSLGPPAAIGAQVRAQVADEQRIPCSVGVGPSKFVAKLASQQAKPDGMRVVSPEQVVSFLHPLPVEAMWGVGEATAERLHRLGLNRVFDLAYTPKVTLQRAFGTSQGSLLSDLAWGRDGRRVVMHAPERSVGSEETFAKDTDDPVLIRTELLRLAARTAFRMRQADVLARTVTLSIRFADFTTLTRSTTISSPTDVTDEIYEKAVGLYERLGLQRARIRRVGVRAEGLIDKEVAYQQPTLDAPERGWREAESASDAVIRKFGPKALQRAALTRRHP